MIKDLGLSHISFVRVQNLLSGSGTADNTDDMTEGEYFVEAPQFRQSLSTIDIGNWNVEEQIKTDEGTLRTYCGYVRFIELDIEATIYLRAFLLIRHLTVSLSQPSLARTSRTAMTV